MHSPSEKILGTKQRRRVLGGEGSSTDRLFNQVMSKEEQNKENI